MVTTDDTKTELRPGVDATELADERTYLAWFRSALAAFAVALAVGKVVPALTGAARVPYLILGVGFAALGLLMAVYGHRRQREVARAVAAGRYAEMNPRILTAITAVAALLGIALLVLLLHF